MLRMVKIKICGLTNLDDARAAIDLGADILSFNFYLGSPRYIPPVEAAGIIHKLPTFVDTAGVFVNPGLEQIRDITEQGFLNWIQLHGDESPQFCDSLRCLGPRIIKAIRVRKAEDINTANNYFTDAILFDGYDPGRLGGTGKAFDWSAIPNLSRRIFLAGGISPDNVGKAVEVGVYGIDICSSIESSPGKKDHEKMKLLFKRLNMVR